MMLRRIARPMLAAWFVTEGVAGFRGAPHHLEPTRTGADLLVERLEITRPTEEQLRTIVKVHGAATAGAGLALALGKAPRVAALVLAALTLPAAVVNLISSRKGGATPEAKAKRREHAIRAVSFAGAALIAAADREGRPGLAWKVSHARKLAAASAGASVLGARSTGQKAAKATKAVKVATVTATAAEAKAAKKAAEALKAATLTEAKAARKATVKGAGAVTAVLGAKAAAAKERSASSSTKPSRAEVRAARSAARADAKAAAADAKAAAVAEKKAAAAERTGSKAAKVAAKADAKAAKLAEKDAARAAKAAAAAEAEAVKAARTTLRADAKAARRLRRSATESVVTPG